MNDPKPQAKEYHEGEQAAKRFEGLVKRAVSVSPAEIQKRNEAWKKERKRQHKRARA
jgi:hypothetical protein